MNTDQLINDRRIVFDVYLPAGGLATVDHPSEALAVALLDGLTAADYGRTWHVEGWLVDRDTEDYVAEIPVAPSDVLGAAEVGS